MRRYAILATMVLVTSTGAAMDPTVHVIDGNGRRGMRITQSAAGGLRTNYDESARSSLLHMLGSGGNNASWLYSGRVPQTNLVLGLTDDAQTQEAIAELVASIFP